MTSQPTAYGLLEKMRANTLGTADGFDRLAAILDDEPGMEPTSARLRERAAKLREGRFTLLVLGEFKRGKSTLLNAMLGQNLLPRKAAPCTAILTAIRYGPTPTVKVLFTDGRNEQMSPADFTARYELKVEDVVGGEDAEAAYYQAMAQDRFKDIDMAEVHFPLEMCKHGVELVDSPGLAEHAARERRTLEYLKKADAVILVLDAVNFLNQRELAFIRDRLAPLGLRHNLFFLINRWNSLKEGLLDPEDPEEQRRAFAEQSQLIDLRLKPLCNVRGADLSSQRIFKANALGALRERSRATPDAAALEESQIPALERSLGRFLSEDRHAARQAIDRNHLAEALASVAQHRRLHEENLTLSLEEVKAKAAALKPKLQELSRVALHIKNSLSAMASDMANRMIKSFDAHLEDRIRRPLPEAVDKFNLGRVENLFVTFDAALDIFRSEGKKFKDDVTAHLQPQIEGYLLPRVREWVQAVEKTEFRTLQERVETELRAEAAEYAAILTQVEDTIGGHLKGVGMEEVLHKWLKSFSGDMAGGVGVDLAPLMAGILADIMAEVTLHMSFHILPGVGAILSAIFLLWRGNRMRANIRKQIVEGMNSKLTEFALNQHEAIRKGLREGFAKLEAAIGGKIRDQVAQLDGDMRSLVEQKESGERDAAKRLATLTSFQARVDQEARTIQTLLGP